MQVFALKNVYVQVELRNRGEEQGNWDASNKTGQTRKLTHFARNVERHAIKKGKAYNYTDMTKKLQNLKLTILFFQGIIGAEKNSTALDCHEMQKVLSESNSKKLVRFTVRRVDTGHCRNWKDVAGCVHFLRVKTTGHKVWVQEPIVLENKKFSKWTLHFVLSLRQPPREGAC